MRERRTGVRWYTTTESWPVLLRRIGGDGWEHGRLRLTGRGVEIWGSRPVRRLRREEVAAVRSESLVATLVLLRNGWPVGLRDQCP